jgi:hypothetical protein
MGTNQSRNNRSCATRCERLDGVSAVGTFLQSFENLTNKLILVLLRD